MENKNLLDEVYLPEIEKQNFYNSKPYQLLKDNGGDPTILENYETKEKTTSVTFDEWINEGGTKEDWIAKHAGPEVQKDFFSAMGDFVLDLGKDGIRSLAVGATNGVDFAVNLAPVLTKLYDMSPIGLPAGTLEQSGIQDDIVAKATAASDKLDDAREFLKNYKDDGNVVSKLVQVMGQDLMYSVPIYNKLKSVGMPTVPAFVISGGLGGAIGIEKKLKFTGDDTEQYNSTFTQDFFGKDISELKRLVGILPNTPYDEIADEVTQAFEYGAFSYAIPKVIDAFKFMKKNIPYFAAGSAMTVAPTDAEANPFKAITNAVSKVPIFKSAVKEAAEQKITKGNADQIYNTIKNSPGVKETELKWLDLESSLKARSQIKKAPLTKDDVLEVIDSNRIDISEVQFGGPAAKLSDELEEKINRFEMRYLDSFEDPSYPNYDVYRFKEAQASNEGIGTPISDKMDFNELGNMLDGDGLVGQTNFLKKDYKVDNGKIEIHRFLDDERGLTFIAPKAVAEKIIEEKKLISSLPSSLGTPNALRYQRLNVYEFEPIEIEKFFIEREKRDFMKDNTAPKFEEFTEPGGENYTELVFKIKRSGMDVGIPTTKNFGPIRYTPFRNKRHMDVKSEIAHVRFKTREIPGPKAGVKEGSLKVLAVEEMQSDFNIYVTKSKKRMLQEVETASGMQLGRMAQEEFGFNQGTILETQDKLRKAYSEKKIDFPFKNNWYELTIKRLLRYAADNGFDAIAIPKGDLAANRYGENIFKATKVRVYPKVDNLGDPYIKAEFQNEGKFASSVEYYEKDLPKLEKQIGSKNYNSLKDNIDIFMREMPEDDLKNTTYFSEFDKPIIVGSGQGKFRLYNETIPSYMKKYGKKWKAKVYDYNFRVDDLNVDSEFQPDRMKDIPVTVLEVTPEMKQSVQTTSQPLFELFGGVSIGSLISESVSDNMENNIISQNTY